MAHHHLPVRQGSRTVEQIPRRKCCAPSLPGTRERCREAGAAAAGGGWAVGSVFPAERRRGPRRRWAAGELGRSGAPSRPARGEGSRAGGAGVRVSPGSLRTAPFPLPPPKVRKVLSRPSQLLNGVSGTSKHGRCAFAMYCYESNWDRSLY